MTIKKIMLTSLICGALVCPAQVRGVPNCEAGFAGTLFGLLGIAAGCIAGISCERLERKTIADKADFEKRLTAQKAESDQRFAVLQAQTNILLQRQGLAPLSVSAQVS